MECDQQYNDNRLRLCSRVGPGRLMGGPCSLLMGLCSLWILYSLVKALA